MLLIITRYTPALTNNKNYKQTAGVWRGVTFYQQTDMVTAVFSLLRYLWRGLPCFCNYLIAVLLLFLVVSIKYISRYIMFCLFLAYVAILTRSDQFLRCC